MRLNVPIFHLRSPPGRAQSSTVGHAVLEAGLQAALWIKGNGPATHDIDYRSEN